MFSQFANYPHFTLHLGLADANSPSISLWIWTQDLKQTVCNKNVHYFKLWSKVSLPRLMRMPSSTEYWISYVSWACKKKLKLLRNEKKIKGEFKNQKHRTDFKSREESEEINGCFVLLVTHFWVGKKLLFLFSGKWSTSCQWQQSIKKFPFVIQWGCSSPEVNYSTWFIWIRVWAWDEVISFIISPSLSWYYHCLRPRYP